MPVPDPKKFTDEELKKYGIHMASRLNEDDANGQGKWADIDDDDEDWAPEAITWGDGTKTAVPQLDDLPPPAAQQPQPTEVPPSSSTKPVTENLNPPIPVTTTAKPPGRGGLILKSAQQEKATLVAKPPPPPGPAKSPWAALPPVDKASPAATEPTQTGTVRGIMREPSPLKGASAPAPAPKEIAADDFNRSSWRDAPAQGNRELFNSQSGRYEPVASDRRGSFARDQAKHPALLQRSGPTDQPAEPSSAFQTRRMSQDMSFSRRRASSNVSGGSGAYYRMMKGNEGHGLPPPDSLDARRPSIAGSLTSPIAQHAIPSHGPGPHGMPPPQPWGSQTSPASTFTGPQRVGPGLAQGSNTVQPQPQPQPQAPHGQPTQDDVEYQKQLMRERNELARKRRQEQEAAEEAARHERIQKKLEAMGPAPPKKSEKPEAQDTSRPTHIQQREYSEPVKPLQNAPTGPAKKGAQSDNSPGSQDLQSPRMEQAVNVPANAMSSRRPSHGQEGRSNMWNGPGPRPDRLRSWNSNAPPPTRNVWASTDTDRALGNGTFNVPAAPGGPGSSSQNGPAPIGPPGGPRQAAPGRPQPPGPIGSRYVPAPDLANKWVNAVAENDRKMRDERLADRMERDRQLIEQGLTIDDAQPVIKDTWRPVNAADGSRLNKSTSDASHSVHGKAHGDGIIHTMQGPSPAGPPGVIGSGSASMLRQTSQGASSSQRTSRFFPSKDIRQEEHFAATPSRPLSPSPPPPDMEGHPAYDGNTIHPHVSLPKPQPVVKLPPNSAPVPPRQPRTSFGWANPPAFRDVVRGASAPQQPPMGRAKENSQQAWQQKFNSLLNVGKLSPPRAMRVDPTSKSALDYMVHQTPATVSLPGKGLIPPPTVTTTSETKPMAEECFDEQEIGSLPRVKMPHVVAEAAWEPAVAQTKPLPKKFLVHPTIMEPYHFSADVVGSGTAVRIFFPGMNDAKFVTLPFSASRGARGGRVRGRGRGRGGGDHGHNNADKSDTTSTQGDHTPSKPLRRGRGGGYRGRSSSNWNSHAQNQAAIHA